MGRHVMGGGPEQGSAGVGVVQVCAGGARSIKCPRPTTLRLVIDPVPAALPASRFLGDRTELSHHPTTQPPYHPPPPAPPQAGPHLQRPVGHGEPPLRHDLRHPQPHRLRRAGRPQPRAAARSAQGHHQRHPVHRHGQPLHTHAGAREAGCAMGQGLGRLARSRRCGREGL